MFLNTTQVGANGTTHVPGDIISALLAKFKVNKSTLIVIAVFVILGLIIVFIVIIFFIKRCLNADNGMKKKKRKEGDDKNIFGDDDLKYESKFGYIDLVVTYDRRRKTLIIRDMQANNINSPSIDPPDCFLKVYMKNAKGKPIYNKKTKIKVDDFTPLFRETFSFPVAAVKEAVVYFQLIDDNPNGNDILLGEGTLDMQRLGMDTYIGIICPTYVILTQPTGKEGKGDVCVILSWKDDKQKIVILEAKDLTYRYSKSKYAGLLTHPYVHINVSIYVNKSCRKKFSTKKVFNSENPYFLETFYVKLTRENFQKTCIKLAVIESLPPKIPRKIGSAYIGNPDVHKKINVIGKFHWDSACETPVSPKAMWHSLQFEDDS